MLVYHLKDKTLYNFTIILPANPYNTKQYKNLQFTQLSHKIILITSRIHQNETYDIALHP